MSDTSVVLARETKTKKVYNVHALGKDTKFLAKEKLNKGVIRVYPFYFDPVDRKVRKKYEHIVYLGTNNGKWPSAGLFTDKRGYGFTSAQGVNSFFKYLDKKNVIDAVVFVTDKTFIKDRVLYLKFDDFAKMRTRSKLLFDSKKSESLHMVETTLHEYLPDEFSEPSKLVHMEGYMQRYLSKYSTDHFSITVDEAKALADILFSSGLSAETIVTTRNKIDRVYIEEVIKQYKELMKAKTETKGLEEKWQQFFKTHNWIFTYIFAFPAVYYDQKVNVGGRSFSGSTDKIVDFLYRNELTDNLAFLEIKTHKTKLMGATPYRKPDIYPASSDLSGSIVQVLDQRNNLLKNYYAKVGDEKIDSVSSQCVVIIGNLKSLTSKERRDSFEMFRSGNSGVTIVTFDELLKKISNLLKLFSKD